MQNNVQCNDVELIHYYAIQKEINRIYFPRFLAASSSVINGKLKWNEK